MNDDEKLFAFVLMPFSSGFDDIYKFGIKEPVNELGFHAERVDEQIYNEGMLDRIYNQIELADVIIADMSGKNPNVFYEVGYAHAKEKTCILLTSKPNDIPFDLAHKRHIIYEDSIQKLKNGITKNLEWVKENINKNLNSNIEVKFSEIYGILEKTKYFAKGSFYFKIDMSNNSNQRSPEIETIYAYTGDGWTFYQDDNECAHTSSDIKGFDKRHFLKSPVQRLRKGQWAQLRYTTKKILGRAFSGEELKDSYKVSGRMILRFITSKGEYDYEHFIDKEIDEIPF